MSYASPQPERTPEQEAEERFYAAWYAEEETAYWRSIAWKRARLIILTLTMIALWITARVMETTHPLPVDTSASASATAAQTAKGN